ncbi:Coatomer subunit delta-1 [Apostasia shenzhenica]|uniref:Coatomer subunit delta n=1 Tax=Apostasia shenzhenica TaxID=1088818 RepID=A0A2I0AJ92_9ASPA|nr:Coatomer subunit delta-1 [Apostasia shenzhenica]
MPRIRARRLKAGGSLSHSPIPSAGEETAAISATVTEMEEGFEAARLLEVDSVLLGLYRCDAPLVSRQFVDMSRIRIEGLLAAFPKLVGAGGKQHTFVETENVRYVYQPIEGLYLLLITNKQNEEGVCKLAFELIFAFDETISLGHKENVTVAQVKQYCEMESHEEKLHKMVLQSKINETKDVMKRKANEIDKSKPNWRLRFDFFALCLPGSHLRCLPIHRLPELAHLTIARLPTVSLLLPVPAENARVAHQHRPDHAHA